MDLKQTIEIPLEEYLELREIKENEKYVKFEQSTIVDINNGKEYKRRGGLVSWKSDSEAWMDLAYLLDDSERRLDAISVSAIDFLRRLKNMSWFEFRQLKKTIRDIGASTSLSKFISGFEAYLPKKIPENPYEDEKDEEGEDE